MSQAVVFPKHIPNLYPRPSTNGGCHYCAIFLLIPNFYHYSRKVKTKITYRLYFGFWEPLLQKHLQDKASTKMSSRKNTAPPAVIPTTTEIKVKMCENMFICPPDQEILIYLLLYWRRFIVFCLNC